MERKIEFVLKSIEEAQETNRFLDTKAGVLVVFESSLLAFLTANFLSASIVDSLQYLLERFGPGYLLFLGIYLGVFVIALVVNILLTLRLMFPTENPNKHIVTGDFEPRNLFFLHELDEHNRIRPSVVEYLARLSTLSDDGILQEYISELLKLSYIRNLKSKRLADSFRLLQILIVALAVFCLFYGLGLLIHSG